MTAVSVSSVTLWLIKNSKLLNMKSPQPKPLPRSWRRAIQTLDHALDQNAPVDFSERLDLLGRQLFGKHWTPPRTRFQRFPQP